MLLNEPICSIDPLVRLSQLRNLLTPLCKGRRTRPTSCINSYGVTVTSLVDVFLKVGEDYIFSISKSWTTSTPSSLETVAQNTSQRSPLQQLACHAVRGQHPVPEEHVGAGYKLIFDKTEEGMSADKLAALTAFVHGYIPDAKYIVEDGADSQVIYMLPFNTVKAFGPFFLRLDDSLEKLNVSNYGVTITSLEDVFLKVGEDHSVTPHLDLSTGIGSDRVYKSNIISQIAGICARKLKYSYNDFITLPLMLLPIAASIAAAIIYHGKILSKEAALNNLVTVGIYLGGYLGAPGLLAEFIVRERADKLRNVLTVMGCSFNAYWIGTFMADFIIMSVPMV
eukprot:gene29408-36460_t